MGHRAVSEHDLHGSAAPGTSVMVQFPVAGPIDRPVHGTAYHWDRKAGCSASGAQYILRLESQAARP